MRDTSGFFWLPFMIALPLVGSILNGLVLRSPYPRRSGVIATLFSAASFLVAVCLSNQLSVTKEPISFHCAWFSVGALHVKWGFVFDPLTSVMALIITGIGTLIHLYSIGYMADDRTPSRYFGYLNLFLFSMLTLVCADNLAVLFVGWEAVGLCSYLLIGYWYQDLAKSTAAIKAFIVNRIGDAGFLIGIFLLFQTFESLEFKTIAGVIAKSSDLSLYTLNLAALFLFVGAMGKSAQIPLYVWLPDAMAGPTPVSALIHAATMVTAGVYLVARMSFLYQVTQITSLFVASIGATTALLAASIATSQRDIKKVLAYSTISQLGLMFLGLGAGAYTGAIFHLMTHAFFKALLFLGAGSVIQRLGGEQDMCKMGGLRKKLPIPFFAFSVGWLAISGVPPLAGFFSKDTILHAALVHPTHGAIFGGLVLATSLLTAFYMTRVYALVFFGSPKTELNSQHHAQLHAQHHAHRSQSVMETALVCLAVGSAFSGFLGVPEGLHLMRNILGDFLAFPVPEPGEGIIGEFASMGIAIVASVLGMLAGLFFYATVHGPARRKSVAKTMAPFQLILSNKFWVDELYTLILIRPFEKTSGFLARVVDIRVIDALVLMPARAFRAGATLLGFFQLGMAQFYLWVMLAGGIVIFWYLLKGRGM